MNPGSVSASDRVPPPMVDSASRRRTDLPAPARTMAAANPLGPEPTTTASTGAPPPPPPPGGGDGRGPPPQGDDGAPRRGRRPGGRTPAGGAATPASLLRPDP